MMGDYDIDTSTKEGAAKAMAVRNKVNAVVTQQTRNIHAAHGAGSGQVPIYKALDEGGDKGVLDPVRELVKRHAMISMGLSPDMTVDELKAKHGGRMDEYEQARRREAEKLDFKGLHADHQKGIIEARERLGRIGSHFQLGTQTEALIEGGDPKLNPVRRLVLKRALIAKGLDPSIVKDDEEDIPRRPGRGRGTRGCCGRSRRPAAGPRRGRGRFRRTWAWVSLWGEGRGCSACGGRRGAVAAGVRGQALGPPAGEGAVDGAGGQPVGVRGLGDA
jgi:hypothetical protein